MMRRMLGVAAWAVALSLTAALAAAPAAAQAPDRNAVAPGPVAQVDGPAQTTTTPPDVQAAATPQSTGDGAQLLRPSAAGAELLAPARAGSTEKQMVHQPAYARRTGVPLMIVGGAMFLAGAIIDDRAGDVLMVAGVVVAAIGLYQYLE